MSSPPTSLTSSFIQRVVVGVGDATSSNNPHVMLSTYALGSCVGVLAYDPVIRVGGILHMMLPDSAIAPTKAQTQPAMFANTGLPLFFGGLHGLKVDRLRLRILVAGGACVLGGADTFKIGERNVQATLVYLSRNGFAVAKTLVGGTINRTLHLAIGTGVVTLKTPMGVETFSLAGAI